MPFTDIDYHGFAATRVEAADGASLIVTDHGAHVVSWVPRGGAEGLYLSDRSERGSGAAIRGGVPVVFPQFATYGPLPRHGLLRTRAWRRIALEELDGSARITLRSEDAADTRALWPHAYAVDLVAEVGASRLVLTLRVENRDRVPLSFDAALHTYLRVADARTAELAGVTGARYRDRTDGDRVATDVADAVRFDGEVDRVYLDVPGPLTLRDAARTFHVESTFRDCVVWNPGPEKTASMADMPPDGYRTMVCVEAAHVANPVIVDALGRWTGTQSIEMTQG